MENCPFILVLNAIFAQFIERGLQIYFAEAIPNFSNFFSGSSVRIFEGCLKNPHSGEKKLLLSTYVRLNLSEL